MMETEKIGEQLRTDTESIKLFKNSKGYNWEIKILRNCVLPELGKHIFDCAFRSKQKQLSEVSLLSSHD